MCEISAIIRINGQFYRKDELLSLIAEKHSNPHLPEWEQELFLFLEEWFSPSDVVAAQTSGSTGVPQIIALQKTAMQQSALRTIDFFELEAGNRVLLSLPCRFIAGKMIVVRAIVGRLDLITVDPSTDFDLLAIETIDLGAMVPNQVFKILKSQSGKQKIENIRNLLIGGSSIPANLEAQISRLTNRIVSTYGMTETASHIAIRDLSGKNRSDIYHCLPGISVAVNEDNCLQIHLPEQIEPLRTTDLAEVISSTSFRILGRIDDAIISGGIKYWPEKIEEKLLSVFQGRFIISSLPDQKLGEKLVLVIEGDCIALDLIRQKLTELLPPFERPKEICFLEKFPETQNGKIKRNEIKGAIK